MKKDARLYIGNTEVELTDGLDILYNYNIDDVTDPTAVKNGFSKTVKIMGTPNNNKIFGHYWNVERIVGNGGYNMGVDFNASKKAPFQIYINNEVYESGYVKLDKVNTIDGITYYECTLYGDLGNFFISLSTSPNTGEKLKLSDLNYTDGGGQDEFDFTVTASTINEAWNSLKNGTNNKWQHINFMTAYNGIPDDFDCNKVILNLSGTSLRQTTEDNVFRANSPIVLADLPEEMTEWDMRDLRSYLQRPCIRMKSIIEACCDSDQNGGYEVVLDPDFFSSGNPYYEKTWLSLPMMQNLEYANEEQILSGSSLIGMTTTGDVNTMMYQDLKFDIGEYGSAIPSSINVKARVFINNLIDQINTEIDPFLDIFLSNIKAPYTSFVWWWAKKNDWYHTGWWCLGSLYVQMIAMNGEVVVGASPAYNLTTPVRHNGKLYFGNNRHYSEGHKFKPYLDMPIYDILGQFENDGFHREGESSPASINFKISNLNSPVSQLKIVFFFGATDNKIKHDAQAVTYGDREQINWIDIGGPDPMQIEYKSAFTQTVGVLSTDFKAILGESLGRTGTKVTKQMLLNTEGTPAEYLLSYCKMFGLYFLKHLNENKISILTRKSYYDRTNVVNLNNYIDRSKDIKITPVAFSYKWYEFNQENDETEWEKKYYETKGVEYGTKVVNTGYEFNVDKKNLCDGNIIKSGIEGLEKSKYFAAYNNDNTLRTWMGMGLHYTLKIGGEDYDVNVPIMINSQALQLNEGDGMKYYDVFPKLQFHDKDKKPTDGNNVLVFFSGFKSVTTGRTNPLSYYITDDNMYQTLLNDGTPCWLFTPSETISGNQIAIKVDSLPVFERYYTGEGSGLVDKSLDFGTAQELYIPDYSLTEDACIYHNFWKSYIEDICDPDTKILECYVRVNGKINDEWLRRFYWFDNTIWRLNKVTDWNVMSDGTTKMEFIRVTDVDGYTSTTQQEGARIRLIASNNNVYFGGESIYLNVICDDPSLAWKIVAPSGVAISQRSGTGNTTLTVTFPANNGGEFKYWQFVADAIVATGKIVILQDYEGSTDYTVTPQNILVPASGGSTNVTFNWTNQGSDYIASYDYNEGSEGLPFTADITTYISENIAVIDVASGSSTDVVSNYCQFQSFKGINHAVTIDQLPSRIALPVSGGSTTITLSNSGATVTDLPYWVNATVNGNQITFTALPNDYESGRTGSATISFPYSSAAIEFEQTENVIDPFVISPENLYYSNEGGTQYISITSQNPWYYKPWSGEWWTVSTQNGAGDATVGITVPYSSSLRSNYAEFGSMVNGVEVVKKVYVVQGGEQTGVTVSVSPRTESIPTTGSAITYTVTVNNMDGLFLTVNATAGSVSGVVSNITWEGNVGTVTITYPENRSLDNWIWTVDFSLYRGTTLAASETLYPTQLSSGVEYFETNSTVNHGSAGETTTLHPNTNTCWSAVTSGSVSTVDAIGFESAGWSINNLIDTGVHPTQTSTMRVKYEGRGVASDRIMGTIEGYGGCSDDADYRIFDIFESHLIFDRGDDRQDNLDVSNVSSNGTEYDITMGNGVVTNNLTSVDWFNTSAIAIETAYTMCVDVGSVWVKEVVIEDNGTTLFSGTPYSIGGVVGLYDSVSDSVKTLYSGSSGSLIARTSSSAQSADWITVTQSGCVGSNLVITTSINADMNSRTGYVNIYSINSGTLLKTITVNQNGGGIQLSVSPTTITFNSTGGTATFTITSNYNWTIE